MVYIMSDIHGNMSRYKSIMEQIKLQETDTLYILGDVIDRYPDGIKILRDIMKKSNVKMLLGNHEYMMLKALDSYTELEEWEYEQATELWYRNGGQVTHNYMKRLRKELRREIFDYLRSLPFNIKIELNGKKFLLVHGSPIENYCWTFREYETQEEFAVWKRWLPGYKIPEGYTLVFGHTPTIYFQSNEPMEILKSHNAIGIDCGCGFPDGRLACVRLDDMKIFYSEEKELEENENC